MRFAAHIITAAMRNARRGRPAATRALAFDELVVLAIAVAVLGKVPAIVLAPMLPSVMGLIAAFTCIDPVSVFQVCGVRVIVDGSEALTVHSSGLCLQKRIQPGTGRTGRFLVARELDRESEAVNVWASAPPPTSMRAMASAVERHQPLKNVGVFKRPRRNTRITPPLCR